MEKKKNLEIFTLYFPIMAITSILHRITGLFLFIFSPIILYLFYLILESSGSFLIAKDFLNTFYIKIIIYFYLSCIIYHILCGIKHIIMDIGFLHHKKQANTLSKVILIITLMFIFLSFIII